MDLLDKAILSSMTVGDIKIAALRSAIRRLDDHDACNHNPVNQPGIVEASRVLYDLIDEIENS
jgi:hypothetical protein